MQIGPIGIFILSSRWAFHACSGWRFCGGGGGVEIGNTFLKKLGSGVVVQRFTFGSMVCFFARYYLSMGRGTLVIKVFGKSWNFNDLWGFQVTKSETYNGGN